MLDVAVWWTIPQLMVVNTEASPNCLSGPLLTAPGPILKKVLRNQSVRPVEAEIPDFIAESLPVLHRHLSNDFLKADHPLFPINSLVQIHACWSLAHLACTATLAKPPSTPMAIRCDALWLNQCWHSWLSPIQYCEHHPVIVINAVDFSRL